MYLSSSQAGLSPAWDLALQWYDANISLPGCDKNMPGTVIAMARLNRPSLMVYGGTINPGTSSLSGEVIDVVSAFQSYGDGPSAPQAHVCARHDASALQATHRHSGLH